MDATSEQALRADQVGTGAGVASGARQPVQERGSAELAASRSACTGRTAARWWADYRRGSGVRPTADRRRFTGRWGCCHGRQRHTNPDVGGRVFILVAEMFSDYASSDLGSRDELRW